MLRPEIDFSIFFAKELEELKKFVPAADRENLPIYILSQFFGSGVDENYYGAHIFDKALEYLGDDASRIDIKKTKISNDLFKSTQRLNKLLKENLKLINKDCERILQKCEEHYTLPLKHINSSSKDAIAYTKSFYEMPERLQQLHDYSEHWLKQRIRPKGRRRLDELYDFVKYCISIYEVFNDEERKAATVYQVGTGEHVTLKGDAAGFINICVSMINRLAHEYGYSELYKERNVVSVVQSYTKHEITNMDAYKKMVLKDLY